MIEIRTFEGTAEELSAYTTENWKSTYRGSIEVPNWTPDYFRWQLNLDLPDSREQMVAAYDDGQLVGVLLSFERAFELSGQSIQGAQASWLTVSSSHRRKGIGSKLKKLAHSRSRDKGVRFHLGYVFQGSGKSLGPRFWLRPGQTDNNTPGRSAGFWVRVLDANAVTQWSFSSMDRVLMRLGKSLIFSPRPKSFSGLVFRSFKIGDLDRCLELLRHSTRNCDLRLVWDRESLGRHLQGVGRCLVAEKEGVVCGFIGYHTLVFSGTVDRNVSVIDLVCVSEMSRSYRAALLDTALQEMKKHGAIIALKLRTGDYPTSLFARWGWVPKTGSRILFSWTGEPADVSSVRRCHVLWR